MARLLAAIVGILVVAIGASAQPQQSSNAAGGVGAAGIGSLPLQPPQTSEGAPRDNASAKLGTATIRGRVFAADSGQPLRKAQVHLTLADDGLRTARFENQLATTDAAGQYEFTRLSAGRYSLRAMKGGYVTLHYGQRRAAEVGKPIEVPDGQTLEKVDFALPRGGVITGRVVDEFGDPSANVSIAVMRYQFDDNGRQRLTPIGSGGTNDLGEFRLFALPPGEYYLSAMFSGEFGDSNDRAAYAPIYYPGTADPDLAERLTVTSGGTVADLSLTLVPVRTARINGTAVDAEGRPLVGFLMAEPSRSRVASMNSRAALVQPDGSFTIGGLTPGEYRLLVRGIPMLGSSEKTTATATITVGADDVTGVRLVAAPPVIATGKVILGGSRAAKALSPAKLRVMAVPDDELSGGFSDGDSQPTVKDDWSFELKLPVGRTRLLVFGTLPEWDLKAVRARGVDVTDTGVDVKPGDDLTNLEIELSDRMTETTGLVTDQRGEPVKDYAVVVFARDPQKWIPHSRSIRTARSDQDGRFRIGGLPPGPYFAYAVEFVEPGQERDVEFLERIQPLATRFLLGEGETRMLTLKLNTAP
jgi:protocatechuate 3,4-dioxygenase beta subunit